MIHKPKLGAKIYVIYFNDNAIMEGEITGVFENFIQVKWGTNITLSMYAYDDKLFWGKAAFCCQ